MPGQCAGTGVRTGEGRTARALGLRAPRPGERTASAVPGRSGRWGAQAEAAALVELLLSDELLELLEDESEEELVDEDEDEESLEPESPPLLDELSEDDEPEEPELLLDDEPRLSLR